MPTTYALPIWTQQAGRRAGTTPIQGLALCMKAQPQSEMASAPCRAAWRSCARSHGRDRSQAVRSIASISPETVRAIACRPDAKVEQVKQPALIARLSTNHGKPPPPNPRGRRNHCSPKITSPFSTASTPSDGLLPQMTAVRKDCSISRSTAISAAQRD